MSGVSHLLSSQRWRLQWARLCASNERLQRRVQGFLHVGGERCCFSVMDPYVHLQNAHAASHVLSSSVGSLCLGCVLHFLAEEKLITRKEAFLR